MHLTKPTHLHTSVTRGCQSAGSSLLSRPGIERSRTKAHGLLTPCIQTRRNREKSSRKDRTKGQDPKSKAGPGVGPGSDAAMVFRGCQQKGGFSNIYTLWGKVYTQERYLIIFTFTTIFRQLNMFRNYIPTPSIVG